MKKANEMPRVPTGIPNLDLILNGGLPAGSITILSGPPGSGKTILTQQLSFHNASAQRRTLFFSTLSEPTAKSLRYLQQLSFFDPEQLGKGVFFVDLGVMLRSQGLAAAIALIMEHLKKVKPDVVVIDSFKVFDDLAASPEELRKFGYEMSVNLMAWETTALLLGEYSPADYEENPFFSIVDGCILLSQREEQGEHQRFLKIVKMRGTNHSRDEHPFRIASTGIELFAPRLMLRLEPAAPEPQTRCRTHIVKLDELLGPGIPWGSSLLIGGVAGTGKTVLSLEFIYRGALAGEKGILFSFEETAERLRAAARGLGWDIGEQIDCGMIEIVFIPQPEIMVESHLLMIQERVEKMKAKRVVIDSVSVLLHKVISPQVSRDRVFQLCSIMQNAGAVAFFATDIPYGSLQVSRFGVEETVVDGVIILSATEEGLERERYIEVYKLRNTAHLKGRHNMVIGAGGVSIYPRYGEKDRGASMPPPPMEAATRLPSGITGLDDLLHGGLLRRSVTLVSGSAGVGKTIMGMQFVLEGARTGKPGLYVTLEEGPEQLLAGADALGLPLRDAVAAGQVQILYVSREHIRAGQFLTVLGDQLTALQADRVVLDAASKMRTEHVGLEEFHHLLYKLTVRFKTLGITSLLTLETPSLSAESVTELGLSPIADNLLMLRYDRSAGRLMPTLTVVKTRGSDHDRRTHELVVTEGGVRVGAPLGPRPADEKAARRP